ncbi:MAG: hypothetical protein KTR31_10715 [Myxococcales bacterium]|nr:hypothetical protein [Myxococcales bacterium]
MRSIGLFPLLATVGALGLAVAIGIFGAGIVAFALVVVTVLMHSKLSTGWRVTCGLAIVVFAVGYAPIEYGSRIKTLRAKVDAGGAEALSVRDCAGLWLLNVGVAVGGTLAGFPELAQQTLLLSVRGPEERTWESDFPMGSIRVEEVVERYLHLARESRQDVVVLPPSTIRMGTAGPRTHAQWRRGLALDPFTIEGVAVRRGIEWMLELEGTVPVDYPPSATLELFRIGGVPVVVDEGLFDALEQRGWLHPYEAHWRWTVIR